MQFLSRTARDDALEENQAANSLGVHLARHSAVMERIPFQADAEMTRKVIGQLFNHLGNNVRRLIGQSTRTLVLPAARLSLARTFAGTLAAC
jgi:hypothetical protein